MPSAAGVTEGRKPAQLWIVSSHDEIARSVGALAAEHHLDVARSESSVAGPCVIDPAIGTERLASALGGLSDRPPAAIIRRPAHASSVFYAMRHTTGRLVGDPRTSPGELRHFLIDVYGAVDVTSERRAYPRAGLSGIALEAPSPAELLDVSPYGARIRVEPSLAAAPLIRLRVRLARVGLTSDIDAQVVGVHARHDHTELRLRFVRVSGDVQQELLKIAKSQLLCRTVAETFRRAQNGELVGYRRIAEPERIVTTLRALAEDGAPLTFARMHVGRAIQANAFAFDEERRHLVVTLPDSRALGEAGEYLCYSTFAHHESFSMDGYVLGVEDGRARLSVPSVCAATDQRAQDRLALGLDSALTVQVGGERLPIVDVSPRGFSFFSREARVEHEDGRLLDVDLDFGAGCVGHERVVVRHRHVQPWGGYLVGVTFVGDGGRRGEGVVRAALEEEYSGADLAPAFAERDYPAERVELHAGDRQLVGLWTEVRHPGPLTVVVIPPAWAKTKESTSLLAQTLAASFDANRRALAVLRLDYSNALGESHKDAEFRQAGKETLGLTFSACVEDICAAIDYAHRRGHPAPRATALIGMSFSGPLCLRAAALDSRVTTLVELMGASDIQDLVRMASGGIDYVAKYRAGIRSQVQNVLGLLADTDRWTADGIRHRLVFLQDAQADAARLSVPVLWVHGRFDAFVNVGRIRSILECAPTLDRRLVTVPCGHIPTKSTEAVLSYVPVLRHLLAQVDGPDAVIAVPTEEQAERVSKDEWARAPRTQLPSPRDYWRGYMLGEQGGSLGFDALAATREYRELMTKQVELLAVAAGDVVHDIGGGMGHAIPFLARLPARPAGVVAYDLVPQVLVQAARRAAEQGMPLETVEWDAALDPVPARLGSARTVLMSLFLSCLADPQAFLRRLQERLPQGAWVVASSIRPDADLSGIYTRMIEEIGQGLVPPPEGVSSEDFLSGVREYMSSAAWLLRLADEGTFRFFEENGLRQLFASAGFSVEHVTTAFGTPPRAVVLAARKSE